MTMNGGVKVATALLAGYALGRGRRSKLVLGASIAAVAAERGLRSRKIPLLSGPTALLAGQAAKRLRSTAGSALTARAESLSEALHERTTTLRDGDHAHPDGRREEHQDGARGRRSEDDDRGKSARAQQPDEDEPQAPERPSRAASDSGGTSRRPSRRAPRR